MTLPTLSILVLTTVFIASCSSGVNQRQKSRVLNFHYGGYGDTLYATLEGEIFYSDTTLNSKNSLKKLSSVSIKILEHDKKLFADSNGRFVINLEKGVFSLLLTKGGFQSLLIKNYVSDPDQYSSTKIYLQKGIEPQTFVIPKDGVE